MLKEILENGRIDLSKLTDIVDLYSFLPIVVKKDSNESANMFYIMTSNMRDSHTWTDHGGDNVKRMLDLLNIKLGEKYRNLAEAYRYFDVNFNNRVSFNEF
jgi:hypothetical protein